MGGGARAHAALPGGTQRRPATGGQAGQHTGAALCRSLESVHGGWCYDRRRCRRQPGFRQSTSSARACRVGGAHLLGRIRVLILSTVILILALTTLCVLATMAALAMERRRDVGLMKALGGSMSRVFRLFVTEAGSLGVLGGLLGYVVGILLSEWMGRRVFGVGVTPRLEVLPLTVVLMVGVALAGALPLRLLGRVRPAVILRGE